MYKLLWRRCIKVIMAHHDANSQCKGWSNTLSYAGVPTPHPPTNVFMYHALIIYNTFCDSFSTSPLPPPSSVSLPPLPTPSQTFTGYHGGWTKRHGVWAQVQMTYWRARHACVCSCCTLQSAQHPPVRGKRTAACNSVWLCIYAQKCVKCTQLHTYA